MTSTLPKVGFKQWEIWLYYMHDNTDKNPDVYQDQNGALWAPVGDLPLALRLVKPGRTPDDLNVFPEKLFVTARFKLGGFSVIAYVGYFINDEAAPRLILETGSLEFVNLNGTIDISDIFPMTDNVQMADLHVMYRAESPFPGAASMALACHQVYYCVRR